MFDLSIGWETIVMGLAVPALVAFLVKASWTTLQKFVVAALASVVLAVGYQFVSGAVTALPANPEAWYVLALELFAGAQVFYNLVFKPAGITANIQANYGVKDVADDSDE